MIVKRIAVVLLIHSSEKTRGYDENKSEESKKRKVNTNRAEEMRSVYES
jgi:hypothetical protein